MLGSYSEFEIISKQHKKIIAARGYSHVTQLFYKTSPLKKIYRTLTFKKYEGWRTYWRAKNKNGEKLYIKVYFGHDKNETNILNGYKERHLTNYFKFTFEPINHVSVPMVQDQWNNASTFFIVSEWQDLTILDFNEITNDKNLSNTLKIIIITLSKLPAPSWWERKYETHNFANSKYEDVRFQGASPFDIDFIHNIALDKCGKIYFFDFEKYQWSTFGMQEIYIALYLFLNNIRNNNIPEDYIYNIFLSHLNNCDKVEVFNQAIVALNNKLLFLGELPIKNKEQEVLLRYLLQK